MPTPRRSIRQYLRVDDDGELASNDVRERPESISGWEWVAEVRRAVPEAEEVIAEHLYDSGELILHVIVHDLLSFGVASFESGDFAVIGRLLTVMERGLLHGDPYVEDCVAVSFVQKAWWDRRDPFIETWPQSLLDEVNRQRKAGP